jgi:hypothetical protein
MRILEAVIPTGDTMVRGGGRVLKPAASERLKLDIADRDYLTLDRVSVILEPPTRLKKKCDHRS